MSKMKRYFLDQYESGEMDNQLTEEEQVALILGTIELGKRAQVKKNLRYIKTALGGTFVAVEGEEEND